MFAICVCAQGGLIIKELQLNICNIFFIFISNELCLSNDSQLRKTRARSYFYEIPC